MFMGLVPWGWFLVWKASHRLGLCFLRDEPERGKVRNSLLFLHSSALQGLPEPQNLLPGSLTLPWGCWRLSP